MALLDLQPTSTALWYNLVSDAEAAMNIKLEQDLESYLVFMLMRFTNKPNLLSTTVAVDYLKAQLENENVRHDILRDVGDQCLLYSGLFPKIAQRRRVQLSYYIELGRGAYLNLSDSMRHSLADTYAQLSQSFISLMDVLQAMRTIEKSPAILGPLATFDLWANENKQSACNSLIDTTNDLPCIKTSNKKH